MSAVAERKLKMEDVLLVSELDFGALLELKHLCRQYVSARRDLDRLCKNPGQALGAFDPKEAALREAFANWATGDSQAAEAKLEACKNLPAAQLLRGEIALESGDLDGARKLFEKAAAGAPTEGASFFRQAECLRLQDKVDEAMKLLEDIRLEFSDKAELHFQEGSAWEQLGEQEKALASYGEALKAEPNHRKAVFRAAYLCDLRGDDDTALDLYQRIGPGAGETFIGACLNMALIHEDHEEYERAMRCCEEVLRVDPTHRRARLFLRDIRESTTMYYSPEQNKEKEHLEATLRTPVSDFELSVRSRNCLARMNIRTLGDLVRKSESEMLGYKNFGETSLREIREMVASKGLRLGLLAEDGSLRQPLEKGGVTGLKSKETPAIYNKPIDEIELSVRSRKCMERLGIKTIGDLCSKSEIELIRSKNFGRVSLAEIKQKLAEQGLSLRTGN